MMRAANERRSKISPALQARGPGEDQTVVEFLACGEDRFRPEGVQPKRVDHFAVGRAGARTKRGWHTHYRGAIDYR
nr:MAG TPA: hypothetical protein [Caudoviricetes sp.]